MHEVSIMRNLLEIVTATAEREGAERIDAIHLRIGEMSGVNPDSLDFAFGILSRGTRAEGGRLECERIPLEARCSFCSGAFHPQDLVFRCPSCGSSSVEIIAGREMEVDYILLDEGKGDKRLESAASEDQ
jgi:hydrogenase nickel incorporation protein HypA/HybF